MDRAAALHRNGGDVVTNRLTYIKPLNKDRCETCFYLRTGWDDYFQCHRNEPQVTIRKECDDEAIVPVTIWPSVTAKDWAGQYAPKKKGA